MPTISMQKRLKTYIPINLIKLMEVKCFCVVRDFQSKKLKKVLKTNISGLSKYGSYL